MNEKLINSMNANIATLNKFDYTQFRDTDVQIVKGFIDQVRELCQIYIEFENGGLNPDDI